ncbi:MAG: hypothetical protein ACYTE3_14595 [Planctomycetota bacterium]
MLFATVVICSLPETTALGNAPEPKLEPLVRVADLNVGESQTVELSNGSEATVKLLDLKEARDDLRNAVRRAVATVDVNGRTVSLVSSTYRLPTTIAGLQIDCPITRGYLQNSSKENAWGLDKDARLRLWPAGSPLVRPGTFVYPVKQLSGQAALVRQRYADGERADFRRRRRTAEQEEYLLSLRARFRRRRGDGRGGRRD